MITEVLLLSTGILFFLISILLASQLLRGAPYLPSQNESVANMLVLAEADLGDKMVDLGSGNGKIVIAFARAGIESHGYEHNPFLIWWSRRKIKMAGLEGKAFIHAKDLWSADFSKFSIITVFGMTHMMGRLEKKMNKQLKSGSRVLSNAFQFPHWEPKLKKGSVFLYEKLND